MKIIVVLFVGMIVGLSLPIGIDFYEYGSMIPCRTLEENKDGARVQSCMSKLRSIGI